MQAKIDNRPWCLKRLFACISFSLTSFEIASVVGAIIAVAINRTPYSVGQESIPTRIAAIAWLFGGLLSIGIAFMGIIYDSHRLTAVLALFIAVVIFVLCSSQMLV